MGTSTVYYERLRLGTPTPDTVRTYTGFPVTADD